MNRSFEYVAGHVPADFVTDPRTIFAPGACLGETNSPVSCVQFLTRREGIVGATTGDSHHQGTGTTTQFWNYLLRATVEIGSGYVGRIPFGYWSTARGGADSAEFFSTFTNILSAAQPSFAVLPGWTYNEMNGEAHADETAVNRFFARLLMTAECCAAVGTTPIFLTPFPRDRNSMTIEQTAPWLGIRQAILSLQESGAIVLDAGAFLGNRAGRQLDGTYLPQYSDDGVHPNDSYHLAIAAELIPIIKQICGLT